MLRWLLLATLFFAACTDYLGEFKDEYGSLASADVDDDHGISSESNSTLPGSTDAKPVTSSSSTESNQMLSSSAGAPPRSSSSSYAQGYFWSASADACGDMWCGRLKEYRVITGVDAGDDYSGYWYDYDDRYDDGNSRVDFPFGGRDSDGSMSTIIDECGGICGTAVLDMGSSYFALAGVGFNVAGQYEESADVSSWGGVCVVYSSACHFCLEMSMGKAADTDVNFNGDVPCAPLQPGAGIVQDLDWSDFKQQGWGGTTMTGVDAAKKLVALKFRFLETENLVEPLSCEFNIKSIGRHGTCK